MLLKSGISCSFLCVRSGWRRPKVAVEFLSCSFLMLTCGLFWHLHCVDKRQQMIVWTEIAGRITGAANGGLWNLELGQWALLPLWPWLGHWGQGSRGGSPCPQGWYQHWHRIEQLGEGFFQLSAV